MTAPSITEDQVEAIRALAVALCGDQPLPADPAMAFHEMRRELTPEVVRQLCDGWIAWANYN
jgi:hypothetical protein